MIPSDASSSDRTAEKDRIREAEEGDDDDEDPPPKVVDRDPSGRFVRYAEPLGKGAYKSVWRAFDEEEGVEVAWNQLRVDHLTDLDANKLRAEVALLSALRHPNVIRLHHAWAARAPNGGETVYFVTELMTSGTLKRYLRKTTGSIRPKFLKHICRQVLSGLSYLHTCQPPVIHRDLKCENIFVNGNTGEVKLGDLGLATVKPFRHVTSVIGTPEFMAPELYDEKYDEKVDVYAFGMCVLEMVTKEYPYSECSNQAQIYKKVTNGIKPVALDKIEAGPLRELIEVCLRFNPDERPAATDLLHHPFLAAEPGAPSDIASCYGVASPDMRRGSVDAGGLLSNSIDMGHPDGRQSRISNNGHSGANVMSALSSSLLSQSTSIDLSASHPTLAMGHGLQLSAASTPSMSNADLHRATSLDAGQFAHVAGHAGIDPAQLAQSHITRQMAQISMSSAGTAVGAEVLSAPSTLRQPAITSTLAAASLQAGVQPTTPSRSENTSVSGVATPAPTHGQVDFVKRIDANTLLLKMISRRPGETKHKCIKFPFILDQDTPEDVVNEMVREQVLDEDDRDLAVCNIRCAVERGQAVSELAISTAMVGSHNSSESGGLMSSSCSSLVGMRRSSSGRSQPDDVQAQLARYHAYQQIVSPALAAMSGTPSSPGHYAPSMLGSPHPQQPQLYQPSVDGSGSGGAGALPFSTRMPRPVPTSAHAQHRRAASSGAIPFELLHHQQHHQHHQHHQPHGSPYARHELSSSFPSPTPLSTSLSDTDGYTSPLSLLRPRGRSYAGDASAYHHGIHGIDHLPSNASHHASSVYAANDLAERFFGTRRDRTPSTPSDVYADYRDTSAPVSRRPSMHSQQGIATIAAAKVKQMAAASASNRPGLQQQQQHGYEPAMLHVARVRGASFASSPRSDHGDLTTDGATTATGDTSMISPLFGSPRLDDGASAVSPGDTKEKAKQVPHHSHHPSHPSSTTGFAEVLVARLPSTAGIGVIVDPMGEGDATSSAAAAAAATTTDATYPLTSEPTLRPQSRSVHPTLTSHGGGSSGSGLSINIPRADGPEPLVQHPMSPSRGADRSSPRSSGHELSWHDDDALTAAVGVDVSDPKLVELWERQRREAEEMARTHMVEWEQLVQDLREKRMADRSTPFTDPNSHQP